MSDPTMQPTGWQQGPERRIGGLRQKTAMGVTALGLVFGGVAGGFVVSHAAGTAAATPSASGSTSTGSGGSTTSPANPAAPADNGAPFKSNEDPTHEAGESAAREAQESAGQHPTVP